MLRSRDAISDGTRAVEDLLMSMIEARLAALGLILPPASSPPQGVVLAFVPVLTVGTRALVSGHGPRDADGRPAGPFGKVGRQLSLEEGYKAARLTALSMLASLRRELGDLDRIVRWVRVFGMVNSASGFHQQPQVINGFSDVVLELFGWDAGAHARSSIGVAELGFDLPVEIEAEVEIRL